MMRHPIAWICTAWLLAGCGYNTGSLMPAGVKTIAVPMFQNETFRRGLEIQLTDAVVQEIATRTELKIAEEALADSVIEGRIVEVDQATAVEDPRDRVTDQQVFVKVAFIWRDRNGEVIHEVENLTTTDSFVVPLGQNLDRALRRAFDKMAEAIVNEMENRDW
jgi:hypothetical protein